MPQATEELRDTMMCIFGSIDSSYPEMHLKSRGYELTPDWRWVAPPGLDEDDHDLFDLECIDFLVQEWDYGGLAA